MDFGPNRDILFMLTHWLEGRGLVIEWERFVGEVEEFIGWTGEV